MWYLNVIYMFQSVESLIFYENLGVSRWSDNKIPLKSNQTPIPSIILNLILKKYEDLFFIFSASEKNKKLLVLYKIFVELYWKLLASKQKYICKISICFSLVPFFLFFSFLALFNSLSVFIWGKKDQPSCTSHFGGKVLIVSIFQTKQTNILLCNQIFVVLMLSQFYLYSKNYEIMIWLIPAEKCKLFSSVKTKVTHSKSKAQWQEVQLYYS